MTPAANLGVGSATGVAFNVNVFNRDAKVTLQDAVLKAGRDLIAQSSGKDTSILAGLSMAGSVGDGSLSGNIGVLVEKNKINTVFEQGVQATAGGNAILEAYYEDRTIDLAGTIAAGGSKATGATLLTVVKGNNVRTKLGESVVTASSLTGTTKNRSDEDVSGIYVGANAKENQIIGGAGVAVSGGANPLNDDFFSSINGVVTVLVNNNKVYSDASEAVLTAKNTTQQQLKNGLVIYKVISRATPTSRPRA